MTNLSTRERMYQMSELYGVSEDSNVYIKNNSEFSKVPIRIFNKTDTLISTLEGQSTVYINRASIRKPMKMITYTNSDGLTFGIRCTDNCKFMVCTDLDSMNEEVLPISKIRVGNYLYSNPDIFENNLFRVDSIIDIEPEDHIYEFLNAKSVIVNGIGLIL